MTTPKSNADVGGEDLDELALAKWNSICHFYGEKFSTYQTGFTHGYRARDTDVNQWKVCARSWMNAAEKAQKENKELLAAWKGVADDTVI